MMGRSRSRRKNHFECGAVRLRLVPLDLSPPAATVLTQIALGIFIVALAGCSSESPPAAVGTPKTSESPQGGASATSAAGTNGIAGPGGEMDAGGKPEHGLGGTAAGPGGFDAGALASGGSGGASASQGGSGGFQPSIYPEATKTLAALELANDWFMKKHPNPGAAAPGNRPSNLWTRAVYYEGQMALYALTQAPALLDYAVKWGEAHKWGLRKAGKAYHADPQCAGQTYIDLYLLGAKKNPERIATIQAEIDKMVRTDVSTVWTWIDAIQMSMPVFARLGSLSGDDAYFEQMWALYQHTRNTEGGGLFNEAEGLWWRDKSFRPPSKAPNGEDVYWSRGNGWVLAALVRVLELLPSDNTHRAQYVADFQAMAKALLPIQREDGFWNTSLHDPTHCESKNRPGEDAPETSGTALFVYGLGWGIRNGLLDADVYNSALLKAWSGLTTLALHDDGMLGYVQSTGAEPCDAKNTLGIGRDILPDFDDFGLGCFLLAGSEVARLAVPTTVD